MPFIKTLSKSKVTGRVKEISKELGSGPSELLGIRLDLLEDFRESALTHFLAPSALAPRLRQLIAVVVSKANSCPFCYESHGIALQALGFPPSEYRKILREAELPEIDSPERELFHFCRKATEEIRGITATDLGGLRGAIGDEGNFVEAVWTIAFFNWINRLLNSLGVFPDLLVKSMNASFRIRVGPFLPMTRYLVKWLTPRLEMVSPDADKVLQETEVLYKSLGFSQAPPFYQVLKLRPLQMQAWSNKARAYFVNGMVPLEVKMLIARVAAKIDGYDWLFEQTTRWLEEKGMRDTSENSPTIVGFAQPNGKVQRILRLAEEISLHSYKITKQRMDELRGEGLRDEEILEIVGVTAFFNAESRLYICLEK